LLVQDHGLALVGNQHDRAHLRLRAGVGHPHVDEALEDVRRVRLGGHVGHRRQMVLVLRWPWASRETTRPARRPTLTGVTWNRKPARGAPLRSPYGATPPPRAHYGR